MRMLEVFGKYGTDKGKNGYADVYEALFKRARGEVKAVLEIGIGMLYGGKPGASLRAWREYFPQAKVYGLDISRDRMVEGEDRIVTAVCDSSDPEAAQATVGRWGVAFDVVVDDGNHEGACQMATLRNLWKYVAPRGYYVVEDIQPGSPMLSSLRPELRKVVGDSCVFLPESRGMIVVSRP